MPLTDVANRVEAPEGKEFKPIPEGVYQVVVKDIDEKIMKKYMSEDEEAFYQFKLAIIDGDKETQGQSVSVFCSRKWFAGNKKAQPSKLVVLVKALYGFYFPNLSVVELEAVDMTPQVINDLIGKQLRVVVKLNNEGDGNKVTEFMAIRQELPIPETVKIASVAKSMLARPQANGKTNVNHPETQDEPAGNPEGLPWEGNAKPSGKKAGDNF